MDKGKKTIPMLFKTFMILLCTLLFGTAKINATNYIINQSKIYIPKEDLSEGFYNEEDEIQQKKNKILKENYLNSSTKKLNKLKFMTSKQPQILNNKQTTNNILISEELQHPQSLSAQNFYSEQENLDDWIIKNIDNLKIRIENYERKIQNIENLLNQAHLKSIKKTNKEYEALTTSLKKEIEKIKKLISTKENLLNHALQAKNDVYGNNQEYEKNQNEYTLDEEYDYPPEENTHDIYEPEQDYFNSKMQALNKLDDKITSNKNLLNNNLNRINELDDKITSNKDSLNNNLNRINELDDKITSNKDSLNNNLNRINNLNDKITSNKDSLNNNLNRINNLNDKITSNKDSLNNNLNRINELNDKITSNKDSLNNNLNRINELDDKITSNKDSLNNNLNRINELDDKITSNKDSLNNNLNRINELDDKITSNKDSLNNNLNRINELDDKITSNKDSLNNNLNRINELDDKITSNKDSLNNNLNRINNLNDKIIINEDALLELKKELINLKNNNYNNLKNIENNLFSLKKVIDELNDRINKNEELYKENKYKFQKKEDKINALDKRLANNENTILTLKGELEKYQNGNLLPRERTKLKHPKNEFYPNNAKIIHENAVIKTADFTIYPDTHSNNYNFKNKSDEFNFKKSNGYYIEIEPTKNLYRAKEIYKLIPKYKVKNYFINPSLKNKETFFRNLIKVEHIDEIRTLYKNLTSEFKNIKIIK
ncbi:hypothetical protein [Borrelia miyamotoi]|uniref:hypothetical protein n=1 Tax=Borrelia miyamotoi TaxID=47466 RepID=UPI001C747467|nr:hypothetical protein [Borrelia miyamotoi]BCR21155.1 Chromosome partition protein Smc [Borrelia miyamotoi]